FANLVRPHVWVLILEGKSKLPVKVCTKHCDGSDYTGPAMHRKSLQSQRKKPGAQYMCCHGASPLSTPPKHESETSTAPTTHLLWRCPNCGGPMAVVQRFTAAQLQLRSPPLLVTAA